MRSPLTLIPALVLTRLAFASPAVAAPTGEATVAELLGQLSTAPDSIAAYDRSYFEHWVDSDGDGCDTRQEVLAQESLAPVVMGSGCDIVSGQWTSWYDGTVVTVPAVSASPINPGDAVNCSNFSTWREAQDWYERYLAYGDIAGLDRDNDGIACETLR